MKSKIFKEFDKDKHVIELDPRIIEAASQDGGVIIATDQGYFKMEKIDKRTK